MNIEPVQYPADQAVREQIALLQRISRSVHTIAVILGLVMALALLVAIVAIGAAS